MSCKILIVEDDSNIAKYIQTCLTMGGYDSEICSDGLSAVERACGGGFRRPFPPYAFRHPM